MQAFTVTDSFSAITDAVRAARVRQGAALMMFGGVAAVVLVALAAPGDGPHLWDWVRLLTILASGAVATLMLVAAEESSTEDGARLAVALGATVVAVAVAATFGLRSAALASLALSLLDGAILWERPRRMPEVVAAALAVVAPWWVWTALDVWDARLLLLIPLAVFAINGIAHARLVAADPSRPPSHRGKTRPLPLSPRGHELGLALTLSAAGGLVVLTGAATGADGGWLALAGVVSGAASALVIAGPRAETLTSGKLLPALSMLLFGLLELVWLASL